MPDYGVGSWPHRRARISPERIALRQDGRELTYRQLADEVDLLARSLAGRGIGRGDRIGYLGRNDIGGFEVFFAAGRLGAIFVPLNTRLTPAEVDRLLDDARPAVLFHGPEQAAVTVQLSQPPPLCPAAGDQPGGITALIEAGRDRPPLAGEVDLADDAVILYTSGTTGAPKGAVLSHGNLTFNTMNQLAHADVLGSDTALCMAPLFHAAGLGQVSLPTLFKGGTVVIATSFEPAAILAAIAAQRITSFSAVPTMLQILCDHPDFAATDLSSLRYVIYGGSAVAERAAVAWQDRGVPILQGYGMTEASPGVYLAVADGAADRPLSIGFPHFFTDVQLAPPGSGPGPAGARSATGELLVQGLNVFRGYWERPAESAAAFSGGWFRSGDVLRIAGDGWAYVVDRIKDIVISGGENIYPGEVEARISALPGITDCAVIGTPDPRWGEVGLAFVVTSGTRDWTEATLRDALRAGLAPFKIPKYVRFVPQLPKTVTGKVRKQDLRAIIGKDPHDDRH
ncbi:MAG TPA: long-chain fatty acid--CoA ligase [Streptosporangiaceae bacterium]